MITLDTVANISVFAPLTKKERVLVASRAADVRLQEGEWLIHEGEQPSYFVLLDGSLDLIKWLGQHKEVIGRYGPGDAFGEVPLLLGSPAVASLRAREDSRILRLDAMDFHTLVAENSRFSTELIGTMSRRVKQLLHLSVDTPAEVVQIVGHRWDLACHDLRAFLARNHVAFEWLDPDTPLGRSRIPDLGPDPKYPTVVLPDGRMLVTPTNRELAGHVGLSVSPTSSEYDVVIVGAGPAGLAAAVYGASEGLRTLLIDREAPGGQAGTSSRIENYLGFPSGLSGDDLSQRAWQQARRFGADIVVARNATALDLSGDTREVLLDGGDRVGVKAVVLATGVTWRRLVVPEIERLVGRGVYYGAAPMDAPGTRGKDVYLVGGGNSAGQAALFFAGYARSITLIERGETIEARMSAYLVERLATRSNIQVRLRSEVVAVEGEDHLERIVVREAGGTEVPLETGAMFIMIGADAETGWLPPMLGRDKGGYILTGRDLELVAEADTQWALERDPFLLESNVPGVFAAGDVRHGSIKRVASGVGEGSMSIAFVHQYLAT